DMPRVRQRKRDIVDSFRSGTERRITAAGVSIVRGEARFVGTRTIDVNGEQFQSERIFINTDARPNMPRLAGVDSVPTLNSTSIMELDEMPRHLLILGGGYIGLEFGQMFRRFGSQVSVVQRRPKLLAQEDDDVADAVAAILREDGLSIYLNAQAQRVEPNK